ncbi:MAG: hypothetical protein AAGG45_10340 [Pseudomonadota bacterium]
MADSDVSRTQQGYVSLLWQIPIAILCFVWSFLEQMPDAARHAWLDSFADIKVRGEPQRVSKVWYAPTYDDLFGVRQCDAEPAKWNGTTKEDCKIKSGQCPMCGLSQPVMKQTQPNRSFSKEQIRQLSDAIKREVDAGGLPG